MSGQRKDGAGEAEVDLSENRAIRALEIAYLQPLCARLMLRMSHTQLLDALLFMTDWRHSDDSDGDPSSWRDCTPWAADFAQLLRGTMSVGGVQRLASHIWECDECKMVFAEMMKQVRMSEGATKTARRRRGLQ